MAARRSSSHKHDLVLFPPPDSLEGDGYWYVTQRPWPSLVFVLPMLLLFEGFTYFRTGGALGGANELVAAWLIEWLVNTLGATGTFFPGLLVIAILLGWHIAARQPWRFDKWVLCAMLGESLLWVVPLFVVNRLVNQATLAGGIEARNEWIDQIIRCLGAGIYEELVFRLIAITLLVIILVDVMNLPRTFAATLIILLPAVFFAWLHHPPLGKEPFTYVNFLFRTLAGIYLSGLFVFRGFGIAAGSHAFYNVIVVTLDAVQS